MVRHTMMTELPSFQHSLQVGSEVRHVVLNTKKVSRKLVCQGYLHRNREDELVIMSHAL